MTDLSRLPKREDLQPDTVKQSYEPTAKQLEWLDIAIQIRSDSPSDVEQACKDLGIKTTRQSWYDWKKIEGFTQWFYEQWRERRKEWLGELDAIGMKFARKGSLEHWKEMNRKVGDSHDEKGGNIQVNFMPILGGVTKKG